MKSVLSLDETLFALESSFKAGTKLSRELSTDLEMENGKYIPGKSFVCGRRYSY